MLLTAPASGSRMGIHPAERGTTDSDEVERSGRIPLAGERVAGPGKARDMIETIADSSNGSGDSRLNYAWRLETLLVRVRWVAVPACFVVLLLFATVSTSLIGASAATLALGNLAIDQALRHHRDPSRLGPIVALATGLEWLVGSAIVVGCSPALVRCMPAVLIILLALALTDATRYGLTGFLGALGGDVALLALVKLVFHPAVTWLALATWAIVLVAASAILGGLLLWLRDEGHRLQAEHAILERLQTEERQWQAERALLERLRAEEQQWQADRAALQLLQCGLSPREQELLPLLARPDLSYAQIAEILSVSEETIRTHLHHIGDKLDVFPRERGLIVAAARERGLLPPLAA